MSDPDLQSKLLKLVGQNVIIGRWSMPEEISGQLIYVMPDSLLVDTGGKKVVVSQNDLKTLSAPKS